MARSVVPPPISISATPASFSSLLNTADDDAKGSNVIPPNSRPADFTHLAMFRIDDI